MLAEGPTPLARLARAAGRALERGAWFVTGACLLASCAHAAAPAAQPARALSPEQVVRIALTKVPALASGARGEQQVELQIATGYHVMSNQPSNPFYIATRMRFGTEHGVVWQDAIYPPAETFRLAEEAIPTFAGTIDVRVPFVVADDAALGTHELSGTLEYQACTRTSCLFPVKRTIATQIEVVR